MRERKSYVSITLLREVNSEFANLPNRIINNFDVLDNREKYLVEAIARNIAELYSASIPNFTATTQIRCNARGLMKFLSTVSPWKNDRNQTINAMTNFGGVSYTTYNQKIAPLVFGNSSWPEGAITGRPFTWGNYMHINASGNPVADAIYPMINTEFTRNPQRTDRLQFINGDLGQRELAVIWPGNGPLVNDQVFHAKEVVGPDVCRYSFVTTVILPTGLGTLGVC